MIEFTEKFWCIFWGSKMICCSPCGREAGECGQAVGNRDVVHGLSTRPEGRRPIRRTRPQVHGILGNMAETELRCHPWLLDSANPWRNDGSGSNKYTDGTISATPTRTPRFVENYPRIFLKSQYPLLQTESITRIPMSRIPSHRHANIPSRSASRLSQNRRRNRSSPGQ